MSESYPLHECVFKGDTRKLSQLLRTHEPSEKDKHGNTPLHLAVMLGRKECTYLLLAHGAPVKVKNQQGWSPLAEAISYGDRQIICSLLKKLKQQAREQMDQRRPNLVKALKQMGDFYMELKWDFHSWVPLISRILPSDVCKIHKSGCSIRLDTTLVDFSDMRWERGDISFIFKGENPPKDSLTALDNECRCYQHVRHEETELEIEDEVDILMSSDILAAQMSTKSISFTKAQSGWIFREDKKETVAGQYDSDLYTINGLTLEQRKRREHLSRDDLQKNKALMESLTKGGQTTGIDQNGEIIRRASLQPPPNNSITWEDYSSAEPGQYPNLGRELVYKESSKNFRATVAMSKDFPLSVDMLLSVLEVIAPFKHFSKLREFVTLKLPSGFPVKIDIPILPTVSAKITFQKFEFRDDISPELFVIPDNYKEDSMSMPFKIVQTIEAGEICLSVVPSGWEANGILWWPKMQLVRKLSQIESSVPNDKWEKMNCVKKRELKTRKEADDEHDRMETCPDTEVEDIPAPPPKKRVRQEFTSKQDFNNIFEQIMTPEELLVEVNAESNPVMTAPMALNDQQLLYVTENVDGMATEEHGESSQIILLSGSGQTLNHNVNLDTLLENQRTIMDNQSKIMQALAKIQTNQEYTLTHCRNDSFLTQKDSKQQVQHVLTPVNSVDELEALERSLDDGKVVQQYSCGMSFICGITGKAQGTDCCYKLVDYFFTRQFLTQCSWTGMVRLTDANSQQESSISADAGTKIPLKFYKNIRALFLDLIIKADKDFSELDCEKFFKTVLKNSKQRLSAKVLTSKHKNRTTNMKYNKSGAESGTERSNRISNENITEARKASNE